MTLGGLIAEEKLDQVAYGGDVIDGCRHGDVVAQHCLFRMYKDHVYSLAMFLCRDAADAAEITQDAFIKVFASIHQFRGDSKFETWLYRIVVNAAHDHLRRWRRFFFLDSEFWRGQPAHAASVEEMREQAQVEESVRVAIASLPEKFREAVVLRYIENLSYEEIAVILDCPAGTVAARLNRAHKMLALKLARLQGKR